MNQQNFDNSGMLQQTSRIPEFFSGRSVLVTGATGFVGKALIEKLLRSCPEVQRVYTLVRPKHGLEVSVRFRDLLKNPVFDRVRSEQPGCLEKLHVIAGDCMQVGLGLNAEDQAVLGRDVSVVFHTAATVRFNEPLRMAVLMNTLGTRRVVELCRTLPKLEAFVHVSTAYSNAEKMEVLEEVYQPPADPDTMIRLVKGVSEDVLDSIESRLIGQHPNTYTFTKAMAEAVVLQEAECLPTAIVRPSIVTAAWMEPAPGWVDNVCGITGICMEVGRGTVRTVLCDKKLTVDLVPVDVVVNTLITAAAHLYCFRPNYIPVYNCTSGGVNPLKWNRLRELVLQSARESPSKYVQWYPDCTFRVNRLMHYLCQMLLHFVPAFIIDLVLRAKGMKPIMIRIYEKTRKSALTGEFFASREWQFKCDNMKNLNAASSAQDRETFPIDMADMKWDKYIYGYMMGIRKFILKDDMSSIPAAKSKLQKLYWGQRVVQGLGLLLLLRSTFYK